MYYQYDQMLSVLNQISNCDTYYIQNYIMRLLKTKNKTCKETITQPEPAFRQ